MPYTTVWNTSVPLDTQAANQGAVDFRSLKFDTMQRMAFISGNLADRPTPEASSGTADWEGFLYWAFDSKQLFRWDGASWIDKTTSVPSQFSAPLFTSSAPISLPADTAQHTIYTFTIPANTLGPTGGFLLKFFSFVSGGGTIDLDVVIGSIDTNLFTAKPITFGLAYSEEVTVINSATNAQEVMFGYIDNVPTIGFLPVAQTEDTTAPLTVSVKARKSVAGAVVTFYDCFGKLI